MFRNVFTCMGLLAVFLSFPSLIFAAPSYPWNVPANVRIVQPAPVDNQRTFASVREAIASINVQAPADKPSAENHYAIKVMPGNYTDTIAFVLPAYVDLVGSGPETTTISASAAGAIIVGGNNRIDNIKITTSSNSQNSLVVINDNVITSINNVNIEIPADFAVIPIKTGINSEIKIINTKIIYKTSAGNNTDQIISLGEGSKLFLINSEIDAELNASKWGYLARRAPNVNISGSKIRIKNNNGSILFDSADNININNSEIKLESDHRIYGIGMNGGTTSCIISGSKFDVNTTYDDIQTDENVVINAYNTNLKIDNSVISTTSNDHSGYAISVMRGTAEINNSNIYGSITVSDAPILRIGNSKITGDINYGSWFDGGTYQYFSCYNGNFTNCSVPPTP